MTEEWNCPEPEVENEVCKLCGGLNETERECEEEAKSSANESCANKAIWGGREYRCGQMEDLKHSEHIIRCDDCTNCEYVAGVDECINCEKKDDCTNCEAKK